MSRPFAVVSEAHADFLIATELADRVLVEAVDWLDESLLDSQRRWLGEHPPSSALTWNSIPGRARETGIRVRGHFDGASALPDAKAARRAVLYLLSQIQELEAIVLIRDADGQIERQHGLEQARRQTPQAIPIVVGVAIPERESWVISGFEPENEQEEAVLDTERQKLGFDPRSRSEELTAGSENTALRSPKRVLHAITQGDRVRESRCWTETAIAVLRQRGTKNGLDRYLNEIRSLLVPLITGDMGATQRSE